MIVIDTDDMNFTDMFVMQKTLALLGAGGTTFQNSYVSYPLCCPSRATFLTGQYAHNHGVVTDNQYGVLDNTNTLAVWLRRRQVPDGDGRQVPERIRARQPAGDPAGMETVVRPHRRHRAEALRASTLNENGKLVYYPRKPQNYIDYVLSAKVNGLLKELGPEPEAVLPLLQPEQPARRARPARLRPPAIRSPPPSYLGLFGDIAGARTPNFDEPDVSDKPAAVREPAAASQDAQLADIDRRYRGRLESLLSVDDEVKRIVGLVKKFGDKRKTFFIFTSDNGLEMGSHRIMFKNYLYEEGERVPLIIRGPGVPQNVTRDQPVANVDLAPTIVAITKATPLRIMDGIDLLPLTQDPTRETARDLLFEAFDLGSPELGRASESAGDRGSTTTTATAMTSSTT